MRFIILILFIYVLIPALNCQVVEFGGSLGGSTYQGDISHFSSRLSIQGAKFLNSVHVGYHFNDYYSVKIKYSNGSIGADDKDSADPWRKSRNLNFRSDISEIALINEFELFDIFRFFRKINIKPYFSVGIAWFKFDPQGKYNGEWHNLQPLSTEGQGLPGSDDVPYKLQQFSIPFGFGLKYFLSPELYCSLEISPRITFTDYLDDVSKNYADQDLLRHAKGNIAANMSYRGTAPFSTLASYSRGNPHDNDWYIFNTFTVGYQFNPSELMKRRRSFRYGRKCNFF